ncbi:MAG: DUF4136 domain-containing protein [bacterium]
MSLKTVERLWLLTIILALFTSCAATRRVTNLSPAYLYQTPSISSYQDPEATLSGYRTFSVFPASLISEDTKTNEIMEKQLLFFLRNCLEAKGYRFVPLDQNPDFLATIGVSSEYKESYVPPSTGVLPVWVPGHTITTYGNKSGTFNFNTYGNYSSYGWGTYSGQSSSTTYMPGYLTTKSYMRPGYSVGHFYPAASISIFDAKNLKNVWLGTGAGTSDNPDVRVSSQLVITNIIGKFPNSPVRLEAGSNGAVGVTLLVFTNDGNNYVPTILSVATGGPAEKAGIKPFDMILSIDGVQLVNKPFSDVVHLLAGDPGTPLIMQVWRTGQQYTMNLIRKNRNEIKW